jgi:hypothetical protein
MSSPNVIKLPPPHIPAFPPIKTTPPATPQDVCDPFSPSYDPTQCGSFGGPPVYGGGGVGSITDISITILPAPAPIIQVPASLGTTIANSVSKAISDSLATQGKQFTSILGLVSSKIMDGIGLVVSNLGTFLGQMVSGLGEAIGKLTTSITTVLQKAFDTLTSSITGVLKFLGDLFKSIGAELGGKIQALIDAVKQNGAAALIPVLQAIVQEIFLIRNVIAAIQTDIHAGVRGILQIPVQLAGSLSSIDATLNRALQQIGFAQGTKIGTDVQFPTSPIPFDFFSNVGKGFTDTPGFLENLTTLNDYEKLRTGCTSLGHDWLINFLNRIGQSQWDWVKWFEQFILDIPIFLTQIIGFLEQQAELAREDVNKLCPIKKLDPATVIQAVIRKFLDLNTAKDELRVQGYDDKRFAVLLDLANQRLDAAILLDSAYRGFITITDRDAGLHALGFTDSQILVLANQAQALPSLADIIRWWNFGVIDEPTFDALTHVLRLTKEHVALLKQTYFTKETVQQQILLHGRLDASRAGYVAESFSFVMPPEIALAAKREQLGEGNVQLQWLAHWQLPSHLLILQSYFRGLRTLNDVQLSMQAENIPQEFWDELIQINQPLLPFRSIPGYYAAGIISEADAAIELGKHGFDPLHIKWIMDYANKAKNKKTPQAVTGIAALSLSTAKTLFDDGVITMDQYVEVLVEHKIPHDVAVLQAQAEQLAFHAKQRKQQITDLIDEVLANAVTVDDALALLHQQGFTAAEIARFQKGIRKALVTTARHPSISEMKTFLKAQVINLQQFRDELQKQGWSDPWLAAFVQLETPPPGV